MARLGRSLTGANNAADYGLNWNAERPTAAQMEDEEFLKTLNNPNSIKLIIIQTNMFFEKFFIIYV